MNRMWSSTRSDHAWTHAMEFDVGVYVCVCAVVLYEPFSSWAYTHGRDLFLPAHARTLPSTLTSARNTDADQALLIRLSIGCITEHSRMPRQPRWLFCVFAQCGMGLQGLLTTH